MWFKIQNQHVQINIVAKPNAKKSEFLAISEQGMCVSLHAKPYHGEANKELISYLSTLFSIPKSQIRLLRGEGNKHKQIFLPLNDTVKELLDHPEKFMRQNF